MSLKNEQLKGIQELQLPDAMTEVGLSEFKLSNGTKLTVKPFYYGKIDDENREAAFLWLRSKGHEALIKHEIKVPLGKGMEEMANKIHDYLKNICGVDFTDAESVHHQTLSAFMREQLEGGQDFPIDTFKGFVGRRAKLTTPRSK